MATALPPRVAGRPGDEPLHRPNIATANVQLPAVRD